MRGRAIWFVAGSAAGVYATSKARKLAYRVSMPGLIDQAAALGLGWRAFSGEVREAMAERESEVAGRYRADAADRAELTAGGPSHPSHPMQRDEP